MHHQSIHQKSLIQLWVACLSDRFYRRTNALFWQRLNGSSDPGLAPWRNAESVIESFLVDWEGDDYDYDDCDYDDCEDDD